MIHDLRSPSDSAVLTKALLRAAEWLGISDVALARTIGVSQPRKFEVKWDGAVILQGERAFRLATRLLELFRALHAVVGGDLNVGRAWMRSKIEDLGGAPIDLIQTEEGLDHVVGYLETIPQR